ncbi:MAG: tRNA (adenosine(37)-N6)-dimethylallyltransferase MiaA [Bacteroidales bacterium]|nr:tRNA (adenosine(37)-N6)-dimethylallyltransferase MiaA [Bacteroidales bacterium]
MGRKLIIVSGPTAVGKTAWSIGLAQKYNSPIISCDSRQIYKEMSIGTAVPSRDELVAVKHYFIQDHSIHQPYTAGDYEAEALDLLEKLFADGHETLVASGGSGFFIEALCNGLPNLPETDPELRETLDRRIKEEGLGSLRMDLKRLDPEAYDSIDLSNPQRVLRAVEVCLLSGKTFSSFKQHPQKRDFEIEKICLVRPREEMAERISLRVDAMIADGLVDEVRSLLPFRNLPALRTVGYSEIFDYLDGKCTLPEASEKIKTNTRRYAKKQLTWWRRDPSVTFHSLSS